MSGIICLLFYIRQKLSLTKLAMWHSSSSQKYSQKQKILQRQPSSVIKKVVMTSSVKFSNHVNINNERNTQDKEKRQRIRQISDILPRNICMKRNIDLYGGDSLKKQCRTNSLITSVQKEKSKQKISVSLSKKSRSSSVQSVSYANTHQNNSSSNTNFHTNANSAKKKKLSLVKMKQIRKIKEFDIEEYQRKIAVEQNNLLKVLHCMKEQQGRLNDKKLEKYLQKGRNMGKSRNLSAKSTNIKKSTKKSIISDKENINAKNIKQNKHFQKDIDKKNRINIEQQQKKRVKLILCKKIG